MRQLSWHSFPQRLGRAGLLATVVAVMTAILGLLLSLFHSVSVTAEALAAQARADVKVQPTAWLEVEDETALPNVVLTEAMAVQMGQLPGVEAATGMMLGRGIQAMSDDGEVHSPGLAPTVSGSFDDSEHSTVELTAGRAPTGPSEVVMDARTLEATGHGLNEEVKVVQDSTSTILTVRVVGTVKVKGHDAGSASFILFGLDQARQLFGNGKENWNAVALHLADDADRDQIIKEIEKIVPFGYSAVKPSGLERSVRYLLHPRIATARVTLLVGGAFIALATIALTATTFGRLAGQQREALAAMRAMGASRRQAFLIVMTEALLVAAAGAFVGALLALLFQGWAHGTAGATGLRIGPPAGLGIGGFLLTIVLGIVCTLVGATHDATKVTKGHPVTPRLAGQPPRWLGDGAWTGLGMMAVGFLLLVVLRLVPGLPLPVLWALFASLALVIGAIMGSALICLPLIARVGDLLSRPFGGLAKVAASQGVGHPARLTLGVSAMLLGTALMTAPAIISLSGQHTAEKRVPLSFSGTYLIHNERDHHFSTEIAAAVAAVPGVSEVGSVGIHEINTDDGPVALAGAAPGQFESVFAATLTQGRIPEKPNEVMISEDYADASGLRLSDLFSFKVQWKPAALRIVGLFDVAGDVDPVQAVATREATAARAMPDWDSWIAFSAPVSSLKEARSLVAPALGDNPLMQVTTPEEIGAQRAQELKEIGAPFQELGGFALLGGALAIALLLTLSVMDREREYGSLRVIGAGRQQIAFMILAEGVVLSVLGVGFGIIAGVLSGWGIRHSLLEQGYSVLTIPWGSFLLLLLLAVPIGLLAAVPAAMLGSRTEFTDSTPASS